MPGSSWDERAGSDQGAGDAHIERGGRSLFEGREIELRFFDNAQVGGVEVEGE
jgi:hypothetical protein